ncbi:hypothetical protein BDV97DRAFT_190171 [Delphinella strobiligena]|nr:hypothetical protein BDV97DRAFT_190171 [Delphinella strobiligena]
MVRHTDSTIATTADQPSDAGLNRTDETVVNLGITIPQQPTDIKLTSATPQTAANNSTARLTTSTVPAAPSPSITISLHLATLRKCLKLALRVVENANSASKSRGSVAFGPQQCSKLLLLLSDLGREIGCVMDEWKMEYFSSLDNEGHANPNTGDWNGKSEQNLASIRNGMAHGVRVLDRSKSGGVGQHGGDEFETGNGDSASSLEELCLLLVILAGVIADVGMVVDGTLSQ